MEIGILDFSCLNELKTRKIIHIDMDAFYASVEERDNPGLKGKPVIIAAHPHKSNGRGVVSTCNYIAREYGVRSAMSAKKALQLCPNGVFISGNMTLYAQVSHQIREIFKRYTDVIEPLSLDEAFLDVTENKLNSKSAIYIARCIQRDIYNELQLTCSAGVSYNKFLAKIASDYQKPFGLTTITPDDASDFIKKLPIEKFFGVGKKTVEKLHERGIFYGGDILEIDNFSLIREYGKLGYLLVQRSRGIDSSQVKSYRSRKSLGREKTFYPELLGDDEVKMELRYLASRVSKRLKENQKRGNTITLKIRYGNFETETRQHTLSRFIQEESDIFNQIIDLWDSYGQSEKTIRLLGVSISGIDSRYVEPVFLEGV